MLMDFSDLTLYSPDEEYTPYKKLHIRCPQYRKPETVYFYLVIYSAAEYGYAFHGCDDQSGDSWCKECRRLAVAQFHEAFPNLRLLPSTD